MAVKYYEIKVSLKGFKKEINRTFLVNDSVKIETFCKGVIRSMNGDLSHLFDLKYKDKCYLSSYMETKDYNDIKMNSLRLSTLLLDEKDKLDLNYDFGDNWHFEIKINKVLNGHHTKNFELIKGVGKGIEDDCGGEWGLEDLINDKNNDWGYDIDDFNIEKINEMLDKYYQR